MKYLKVLLILLIISGLAVIFSPSVSLSSEQKGEPMKKINENLTPEEERVMMQKETEAPFSGKYYNYSEEGVYTCKNCGASLFKSSAKFESGTGWPSFDDEIEGAVLRIPDPDGMRTEIVCARCGGHLGHVFLGQGFTEKDNQKSTDQE